MGDNVIKYWKLDTVKRAEADLSDCSTRLATNVSDQVFYISFCFLKKSQC